MTWDARIKHISERDLERATAPEPKAVKAPEAPPPAPPKAEVKPDPKPGKPAAPVAPKV